MWESGVAIGDAASTGRGNGPLRNVRIDGFVRCVAEETALSERGLETSASFTYVSRMKTVLDLAQADPPHGVIAPLLEHEVGALACGQHVLPQVHEVHPLPDTVRDRDGLGH